MLASILQNQNQTPHTTPKNPPKGPDNSLLRPASDGETMDTGQNLPLIHVHQQDLAHNVDNGDTGEWTICRENSFFLEYSLKFQIVLPTEDPIPMFPLGD
jgi:hypothetical protein